MVSLRFLAFVGVMVAAALPLACASSGSGAGAEDIVRFYPEGMLVFSHKSPPRCPYEEVGRLTYEATAYDAYDVEDWERRRVRVEYRKGELYEAFEKFGADAVLEGRRKRNASGPGAPDDGRRSPSSGGARFHSPRSWPDPLPSSARW